MILWQDMHKVVLGHLSYYVHNFCNNDQKTFCMCIVIWKFIISFIDYNLSLQGILSIPTHAFATFIQINCFCDFRYDYPSRHLVKRLVVSHINNDKVVCSCIYLILLIISWFSACELLTHVITCVQLKT